MKLVICIVVFILSLGASAQKNIEGTWEGKLKLPAASLRLVLHLKKAGSLYTATLDSPDQGAKGIATSGVQLSGDSLIMEVPAVGGRLQGLLQSDSSFSGEWVQGVALPLQLKKVAAVTQPKRPQTPQPPFTYFSQEVIYYNKDGSIKYSGTITIPVKTGGLFPALILISGSGQQNRDEELFGHKPFAVLADYLINEGYVVLRVDDRGIGGTTGDVKNATSADFAKDVSVSLDYLKSRKEVDKSKLGLIGHSEDAMIAQLVATQRTDVAFVVSLAGPGQPITDLMADQNAALFTMMDLNKNAITAYKAFYKTWLLTMATQPTDSAARQAGLSLLQNWLRATPDSLQAVYAQVNPSNFPAGFVDNVLAPVRTPWFSYFISYNPGPFIRDMKGKVLVLNGSRDIQVASGPNLKGWRQELTRSKVVKWEAIELAGLNHLFQHCNTCTVQEYGELEETFAPEALASIGEWLRRNIN